MKQPPPGSAERVAKMTVASVYPHYLAKVEKKDRTKAELNEVIEWLTGYDASQLESLIKDEVTFGEFFERCTLNPNAKLITGTICGYKVQEIEDPILRQVRYLDKLVDELAKGFRLPMPVCWHPAFLILVASAG